MGAPCGDRGQVDDGAGLPLGRTFGLLDHALRHDLRQAQRGHHVLPHQLLDRVVVQVERVAGQQLA